MLDPYKMVVVNTVISILLVAGILFYKFIYPKKNINLFLILLILSLLPLVSIFRKGTYESGDLSLHVKYSMDFYKNLSEGNIIPKLSSLVCAGYACPDFIFMYPLPYYIISFFHFLGFHFINSVKLFLILTYISSGIFIYYWIKEELGKKAAFVASIFYLYAPYHLVNMHFRVDIAELASFVTLPLCFLTTYKTIKTKQYKWFFINILSFALYIISHPSITVFSFPFIIIYGIFTWSRIKKRNIKNLIYYFISVSIGILLMAFYWIPVLFEGKYIYWSKMAYVFFPDLYTFIYSPWRFGLLFQGPKGELVTIVGYIQSLLIIFSTILLIKQDIALKIINYIVFQYHNIFKLKSKSLFINPKILLINKNYLLLFLLYFYIVFFMTQPISEPLWKTIPLLINIQFTSRLLVLIALFTSVIAAILSKYMKFNFLIILLCLLAIFPTILNWGNRGTIPVIDDDYLKDEMINKRFDGLDFVTPIWVNSNAEWINTPSKQPIEVISGQATITQINRNSTKREYLIQANEDVYLKENTFYFPGWILKINNRNYPFEYNDPEYSGLITFHLKKGIYKAELIFQDTTDTTISKIISGVTFLTLIIYTAIFKLPKILLSKS